MYDSQIGRWTTPDPKADKYYSFSPIAYVANNPLKYIDPDGKEIIIVIKRFNERQVSESVKYSQGKLYTNEGKEYTGKNSFALKIQSTLNNLYSTNDKKVVNEISTLEKSDLKHYIEFNPFGQDNARPTAIDLNGVDKGDRSGTHVAVALGNEDIENGTPSSNETTLAHELNHSYDYDTGNMIGERNKESSNTDPAEIRSVNLENRVRSHFNLKTRTTYGGKTIDKSKLEDPKNEK
jgi:hypothetical protein